MLLLLPFALIGLAALFYLLIVASARALPFGVAACTAFAIHAATGSAGAAAVAAAAVFLLVEAAAIAGGMVAARAIEAARGVRLSAEQRGAFDHLLRPTGLALVTGYAGTGKSTMLGAAREAWELGGYRVSGAALSGIAAENLQGGSGIASRTLASFEYSWARGADTLTARDILVVDEAGMIGTRQMERLSAETGRSSPTRKARR